MKIKLVPQLLMALCLLSLAAACKKEKNHAKTPVELLTEKPWNIVFFGTDDNHNGILEVDGLENNWSGCQTDDTYEFDKNGTFMIRVHEDDCSGANRDGGPFPWSLAANGKDFQFSGLATTLEVLDEHNFKTYEMLNGEKYYRVFKR
ncbi:MAG: hypothetical protein J7621_13170 [Niastella sp.]|nr:hypothetical protein [Niastella sp.]